MQNRTAGALRGLAPGEPRGYWNMYFAVADVDAALARAEALGGKRLFDPLEAPGFGRGACIDDPAGVGCHVIRRTTSPAWVPRRQREHGGRAACRAMGLAQDRKARGARAAPAKLPRRPGVKPRRPCGSAACSAMGVRQE